jgi:hypothetical protein
MRLGVSEFHERLFFLSFYFLPLHQLALLDWGQTRILWFMLSCFSHQIAFIATLFGFLPVGVLGLMGYVAILAVWIIQLSFITILRSPVSITKRSYKSGVGYQR